MDRKGIEPTILTMDEPLCALGAGMDSSDKSIYKDAAALGERFAELRRRVPFEAKRPRLFVAATSDYDRETGKYRYAMGDAVSSFEGAGPEGGPTPEGLERIAIPAGLYAAFPVRPLLGFLWGPAIGRAYAYIYGSWLPRSAWRHDPRAVGTAKAKIDHFEYHDERASRKRRPEMEIRVPIASKF